MALRVIAVLLWFAMPLSQAFFLVVVPLPDLSSVTGYQHKFLSAQSGIVTSRPRTSLDMSSKSSDTSEFGEPETEAPSNTRCFSGMRLGLVVDDDKLGKEVALSKLQRKRTKGDFETNAVDNAGFTDDSIMEFNVGTSRSSLTDTPPSSVPPMFVFQDIVFGLFTIVMTSLAFGKSTPTFFYDTLLISGPQYTHTLWIIQGVALTALSIGAVSAVSQGGIAMRANMEPWVWATKGFLDGPWAMAPVQEEGMTTMS